MKIKNKLSAKLLCTFFVSSVLLTNCKKENETVPQELETQASISADSLNGVSVTSSSLGSDVYRIERALPSGYVKDGSRDYTAYIQRAINNYSQVAFPAFPIMVNDAGITIPSNRRIYFINGSEIRLKPSSKSNYYIFRIANATNVSLIDPVIRGDRSRHLGSSGEWGMGISVISSSNVTLQNPKVRECWGDGIYLGRSKGVPNRNVKVINGICTNNRRNGMSIISANGLTIDGGEYSENDGISSVSCGIDFEPENSRDELQNIVVSDVYTEKNINYGIQVGFSNLYGGSSKRIGIRIINHKDASSTSGFKTSCYTTKRAGSEVIAGTLSLENSNWQYNSKQPCKIHSADANLKVALTNPTVRTTEGTYISTSTIKSYLTGRNKYISPVTAYQFIFN